MQDRDLVTVREDGHAGGDRDCPLRPHDPYGYLLPRPRSTGLRETRYCTFVRPHHRLRHPDSRGPVHLATGSANAPKVSVPAFCRSKLLSVGNGGLAGTISYAPMVKPLQLGDATSSTDTDHTAHGRQ